MTPQYLQVLESLQFSSKEIDADVCALREKRQQWRDLIVQAREVGIPRSEIIKATGKSKATVDAVLKPAVQG